MSLATILDRITTLVKAFFPGRFSYDGRITIICRWILNHPLVLFFVLISLLSVGINIIRRMIRT